MGGSVAEETALAEVMVRSKLLNMLQIGAILLVIAPVTFRSLVAGLLVVVPLVLAVLANFGLMGFTGIPLNISNSLTSAMVVGVGADYAIYLIFRLREELARTADQAEAVRTALRTAGKATLFVASAVAGGYAVLLFSFGFYQHVWMAILIGAAMIVSCFATLTVVPALLLMTRPAFVFRPRRLAMAGQSLPLVVLLVLGAAALRPPAAAAQTPAPEAVEIMRRNFMASRVGDSDQQVTITLTNRAGQQRVRRLKGWSRLQANGIDNRRMVRYEAPADVAGTATLLVEHSAGDDDIWLYLPALRRVRRLVASNKKESFLGTDFSYGDVIGQRVDDWRHSKLADETVDGQPCHVIESVPASPQVGDTTGYSREKQWIRKDNAVTVRAEFWDQAGQPLKRATYADVRQVDAAQSRWQAMRLEAENLQTGHRTVIQFDRYTANVGVPDEYFTTRYLER